MKRTGHFTLPAAADPASFSLAKPGTKKIDIPFKTGEDSKKKDEKKEDPKQSDKDKSKGGPHGRF